RGYDALSSQSRLELLISGDSLVDEAKAGDEVELVVAETPLYAESGGQVGDTGVVSSPTGRAEVLDTQRPVDGLVVHRCRVSEGQLRSGQTCTLEVDASRRQAIRRNHSATHLLHWALR